MKTLSSLVALALTLACGGAASGPGQDPTTDVALLAQALDLPPAGRYQLTAPLIDGAHCPEVSMSTVDVASDGTATIDPCPRGWSCSHTEREPLLPTYTPTLPKSGGAVCAYDASVGSFGPWLNPQPDETPAALSAPAVLVGGIVEPVPAETPTSHDLELSDGTTDYRVMFGTVRSGQAIADRINAFTGATITASVNAEGRLVLTTVETGPGAELTVLRGAALPMLGLERGSVANGF